MVGRGRQADALTVPRRPTAGWLLAPALAVLLVAFALPIAVLLSRSLFDPTFTLQHYARLFAVPEYLEVLGFSLELAAFTTALALAVAYPYAYALTRVSALWRGVLIAIVLLPFWTNILVRCYSWMLILQTKGLLNTALVGWLGVTDRPLALMYNFTGVTVGMVHYLLPPAVLILFGTMRGIDRRLVQAAEGLGAPPVRALWRVFVPLSLPGVRAAGVLIFILSLGFFVTPALLGGRRDVTIAMLIDAQVVELTNWGFGAALAALLLAVTVAGLSLYYGLLGARPHAGAASGS